MLITSERLVECNTKPGGVQVVWKRMGDARHAVISRANQWENHITLKRLHWFPNFIRGGGKLKMFKAQMEVE